MISACRLRALSPPVLQPATGVQEEASLYVGLAGVALLPLVVVFSWRFDVSADSYRGRIRPGRAMIWIRHSAVSIAGAAGAQGCRLPGGTAPVRPSDSGESHDPLWSVDCVRAAAAADPCVGCWHPTARRSTRSSR